MSWLTRLRNLYRADRLSSDIDREMAFHLAQRTDDLIAMGYSPQAALDEARRRFGNVGMQKENTRERDVFSWLESFAADLAYAFRRIRESPGFATVAILSLALGIGATTTVYSAVTAVMLRPIAASDANRLAYVSMGRDEEFSYRFYERLRDRVTSFSDFAAVERGASRREMRSAGGTEVEDVKAQAVTGNFFSVLGLPALVGRTLANDDDRAGAEGAVVISEALWKRRFGATRDVVGATVLLSNVPVTIVGVMPEEFIGFEHGAEPDVWWPMQLVPRVDADAPEWSARLRDDGTSWLVLFGRLRPGVSREQAQAQATAVVRAAAEEVANKRKWTPSERARILGQTVDVHPGATGYVAVRGQISSSLLLVSVAVALVLLIACANLAGLLLARATAREQEFALRTALGAGKGRIVRQLITESTLLSALGGSLGIVFAYWGTTFLTRYLPSDQTPVELRPDARVLVFAVVTSLLTGVILGLAPALKLSSSDLVGRMNRGSRTSTFGPSRQRTQSALVTLQVALSVLLLAGAALFGRTLHNLQSIDLGFSRDNLISFTLEGRHWQTSSDQRAQTQKRLLDALGTLHGVRHVTLSGAGMLSGNGYNTGFTIDGYVPAPDEEMRAQVVLAGPRFFETVGVPLLRGRDFTDRDQPVTRAADSSAAPAPVVVLGEALAKRYFGDVNPIGRHITQGLGKGVRLEVVGVARDTKYSQKLRAETPLEFYVPFFGSPVWMPASYYLRTDVPMSQLAPELRRIVAQVEPRLDVHDLHTVSEQVNRLLARERLITQLVGFFSTFAVILASLGLYGLLSYSVARRTREIGVRVALGATLGDVLRLVVGQGLTLALVGCAIGIIGALALTRSIASLLYGVGPADPLSFGAVTVVLLIVAAVACWLPARRATKVDPMVALRVD